jgi:hypothetical protein
MVTFNCVGYSGVKIKDRCYMELTDIYKKYSHMTDKGTSHSYLSFYKITLPPFIKKKAVLLELGVWSGGSLLLWEEYLVDATIHGIDISEKPKAIEGHPSIVYHRVNCTDEAAINNEFKGMCFDVIIDDASHQLKDQLASFDIFYPMLKEGGIYVIEDVLHGNIEYFKAWNKNVKVYDFVAIKKQIDDVLVVITK